jgi:hypothetical protein
VPYKVLLSLPSKLLCQCPERIEDKGKGKGKGKKIKLSLCLTKHHAMKTYWRVRYSLTSALEGGE